MKIMTFVLGLLLAFSGFGSLQAFAQDNEDVRGAFLTTRPKAGSNKPAGSKPSRRRPKKTVTPDKTTVVQNTTPTADPTTTSSGTTRRNLPRMGLGLTLFLRDSNGLAIRTDPTRGFKKGDRVRVLLETNTDGYLYIFNTTNDQAPVMIYPDPELDEGGNYITSHVPFEIPASTAAEERLRWFAFDQNAGNEKLYFVFTREPLPATPIEDDLIALCRETTGKCPWQPGAETWALIQKELTGPAKSVSGGKFGRSQTNAETQAVTRGIGLNRDDPEPSLIMLSASTDRNILVATLNLLHQALESTADPDEVTGSQY